jgi:hypothetical protein
MGDPIWNDQQRLWAYLELPCDVTQVGDLENWTMIAGDPLADAVELLRDLEPFIGYEANVQELQDRAWAFIKRWATFAAVADA